MSVETTGGLSVSGLTVGYGAVEVVHDFSVDVSPGEIVALLGRNGAGKTTTLLGIAGYLRPSAGDVRVDGSTLTGPVHARMRQKLGIVLEGRSVFGNLSVQRNMDVAGVKFGDVEAVFPELTPRRRLAAGTLSGGEQQMLALGRAIARGPQVLLIDELSFGLSPIACGRLFGALREFARNSGMAVLLVEQHLHYAQMVADRALVMNLGQISLELPAAQLESRKTEIESIYLAGADA